MPQMTVSKTVTPPANLGGQRIQATVVTSDNLSQIAPAVPAAKDGTLTTRTDNTSGVLTVLAGHGVLTTDKPDIFFAGVMRRGVTVSAVTSTTITFTGGAGDNLPPVNAVGTFMIPHAETPSVVGVNVTGIFAYSEKRGFIVINQANGTLIKAIPLQAGELYVWIDDSSLSNPVYGTNPVTGVTVGQILMSHDDSAAAHQIELDFLYN